MYSYFSTGGDLGQLIAQNPLLGIVAFVAVLTCALWMAHHNLDR